MQALQATQEVIEDPSVKYVIKRDGTKQPIDLQKIRNRFINKAHDLNTDFINFDVIVNKVSAGSYSGITSYLFFNSTYITHL